LRSLSNFFSLAIPEKWLLIKTFFILLFLKTSLVILPFAMFKKMYKALLNIRSGNSFTEIEIEKLVFYTKAISANVPLGFTCLPQALTLKYYLRRDVQVQVIIGVNTETSFKAHAWVEKNKNYLIGDLPFETYTPLWTWS
jgi:Transglutaminase-like superfamily